MEGACGGALNSFRQAAEKHAGVAHSRYLAPIGGGDRFFHKRLLHPDAHVARDELENVFARQRGAAGEQGREHAQLGGGPACGGGLCKRCFQIAE